MKNQGCFTRPLNQRPFTAVVQSLRRTTGTIGLAILTMATGIAIAQNPTPAAPLHTPEAQVSAPAGYTIHQGVDLGGRMTGITGSNAMYSTLVNLQSGPRVLGETFEMRALPSNKHTWVDNVSAFGTGFGGDPNSFSRLSLSKGKVYEFSGIFRRDRRRVCFFREACDAFYFFRSSPPPSGVTGFDFFHRSTSSIHP